MRDLDADAVLTLLRCPPDLNMARTSFPLTIARAEQSTGYRIGRGSTCDVVLSHQAVARLQCFLAHDAQGWFLRDIGSTNPQTINAERVASHGRGLLKEGDEVGISEGIAVFRFSLLRGA